MMNAIVNSTIPHYKLILREIVKIIKKIIKLKLEKTNALFTIKYTTGQANISRKSAKS